LIASEYAHIGCLRGARARALGPALLCWMDGAGLCTKINGDVLSAVPVLSTGLGGARLRQGRRLGGGPRRSAPVHGRKVQRGVALGVGRGAVGARVREQQLHAALVPKARRPVQRRAACARAARPWAWASQWPHQAGRGLRRPRRRTRDGAARLRAARGAPARRGRTQFGGPETAASALMTTRLAHQNAAHCSWPGGQRCRPGARAHACSRPGPQLQSPDPHRCSPAVTQGEPSNRRVAQPRMSRRLTVLTLANNSAGPQCCCKGVLRRDGGWRLRHTRSAPGAHAAKNLVTDVARSGAPRPGPWPRQ